MFGHKTTAFPEAEDSVCVVHDPNGSERVRFDLLVKDGANRIAIFHMSKEHLRDTLDDALAEQRVAEKQAAKPAEEE